MYYVVVDLEKIALSGGEESVDEEHQVEVEGQFRGEGAITYAIS